MLVAPDLDIDVAVTKIFKVFSDPDRGWRTRARHDHSAVNGSQSLTMYVSQDDKALATSGWLFGSIARLGRRRRCHADQIELIGNLDAVNIIEGARGPTFSGTTISFPIPT